jgi:hypothetical protein
VSARSIARPSKGRNLPYIQATHLEAHTSVRLLLRGRWGFCRRRLEKARPALSASSLCAPTAEPTIPQTRPIFICLLLTHPPQPRRLILTPAASTSQPPARTFSAHVTEALSSSCLNPASAGETSSDFRPPGIQAFSHHYCRTLPRDSGITTRHHPYSAIMETITLPHLPDSPIQVCLFNNVQNAAFLRQQLLEGNTDFEYAFLDASVLISRSHVLAACFRAICDSLNGRLKSRNVHSEIVFSLSSNNNVSFSLSQRLKLFLTNKTDRRVFPSFRHPRHKHPCSCREGAEEP